MGKLLGLSAGAVFLVVGFYQGLDLQRSFSSGKRVTADNMGEILKAEAVKLNKKKGKRRGYSTFKGAYVRGRVLSMEYTVHVHPRRVNTVAASDKLRARLKKKLCRGAMFNALRQGAMFEITYRAKRHDQFLFEVRFDESNCNNRA